MNRTEGVYEAIFEIHIGRDKQYWWRLIAPNGQIIATSHEGYMRKHSCKEAIGRVRRYVPIAEVIDSTK